MAEGLGEVNRFITAERSIQPRFMPLLFTPKSIDCAAFARHFGAMNGRQTKSEGSLGRVLLAVAIVYLLLLRALFMPFPGGAMPADFGLFGGFVICSHASGANDQGDPASDHHDCCDGDCCLMRIAGLLPLILVTSLILFGRLWGRAPVLRAPRRIASGPLARIAARPQAPRAPPHLRFV